MTAEINGIDLRKQPKDAQCDSDESLDEFLDHELLCFLQDDVANGDTVSVIDLDKDLFLTELESVENDAENRSVDDILLEAELLMHKQPMFPARCEEKRDIRISTPLQNVPREATLVKMLNGLLNESDFVACAVKKNRPDVDRHHKSDRKEKSNKSSVEAIQDCVSYCPPADVAVRPQPPTPYTCDKSTQPSPESTAAMTPDDMPGTFASWSQERSLETKLIDLEERLKDTEERYKSLKLQYDTLSQVHRTLRENYNAMQEESEKMQFHMQHLTKCANVLRRELQSARSDRDSAIELQKIVQSELDESRKEKRRLQDCSEKDNKTIQDLQRQCREMERILMRKNPDSISALIVASKSTSGKTEADNSTTCRLLEHRIAQLESDARKQDAKAQSILADVQSRFNSMQAKYETHIADLEMQVLSLQEINSKLNEKIIRQMGELASISSHAAVATPCSGVKHSTASCTQTDPSVNGAPDQHNQRDCPRTRSIQVQTDGEVAATRHQQQQIAAKRAQAQGKEDAHLLATIRGMRVDLAIKEKAVQRLTREVDECKKTIKKIQKKKEGPSCRSDSGRSPVKVRSKVLENAEPDAISSLREAQAKMQILEMDYKTLEDKRLLDLKTLQAAHEKELASCHESIRILQQRLADSEEEMVHRKDKQRPSHNNDYYGLKAKVAYLERRHTEREQRLLMLVEALSK